MTETNIEKKQYGLLDIVKFIMALLVVTIHRPIGDQSNFLIFEEVNVLASMAVPFFFATSSFLFFTKANRTDDKISVLEAYVFRLFRLLATWTVMYIPSDIYRQKIYFHNTWAQTFSEILKFSSHLWFLPALAISMICVYYGTRKNPKITGIISCVLLIFSFFAGFNKFYLNNCTTIVYILFEGIPYVFLGYCIANQPERIKLKPSVALFALFLALSFIEGFIEFRFLSNTFFGISRICYLPTIYFLIEICLNVKTKKRKIYVILRKSSTIIYLSHLIIYQEMLWLIFYVLGIGDLYSYPPARLGMTFAYVAIGCIIILLLENKKGFRWLKKLYN